MIKHYSRSIHFSTNHFVHSSFFYWSIIILTISVFWFADIASAQDVIGAAKAFSRAQKAELAGDFAMAAEYFELADSLAPSPEALRSAIRSRKAAGQLGTAALHAESLRKRYPNDVKSQKLAQTTIMLAKQTLTRLEIECKRRACTLLVDDAAAAITSDNHHVIYVEPGTHEVIASFDDQQSDPRFIEAEAGKRGSLVFIYTPDPVRENQKAPLKTEGESRKASSKAYLSVTDDDGLPIWYFLSGVAVTVGAGAATLWSGLDVLNLHDEYEKNQTQQLYESGLDRELRTNILIGVTAALGAATCVLALFTQWDDSREADSRGDRRALVGVGLNSGLLNVSGTF